MKYFISALFFPILILLAGSCNDNPVNSSSSQYSGTWLWIRASGGIMGRSVYPENGQQLKITLDKFSKFTVINNGTIRTSGNYRVSSYNSYYDKITFTNVVNYNYDFQFTTGYANIHSDTLIIWDGAYDGYEYMYKKQNY